MLGGITLIAEYRLQRLPPGAIAAPIWVVGTFVAWGLAFGWAYDRLSTTEDTEDTDKTETGFTSVSSVALW
jgi:hypothetical protein